MTPRMHIDPERLRWARRRAGLEVDALVKRFPKYLEWERGEVAPTYKQLEKLATATHAPLAAFFFSKPLDEEMDLPDLRTVGNRPLGSPSLNLRHTIYACELRQDWYRGYALSEGEQPLALVGSLTLDHDPCACRSANSHDAWIRLERAAPACELDRGHAPVR